MTSDPLALPGDAVAPADWLSAEAADPFALPTDAEIASRIQSQTHATEWDSLRFACMKGSSRVWACDGKYVACRPSGFNDTMIGRHQRFLRCGHYKHIGTFDDVQIFEVLPASPFYHRPIDARQADFYQCMRGAAIAAVNREWVLYHDILEELATRCKSAPTGTSSGDGGVDPGMAKERWDFVLQQIFQQIYMRNGPTQAEVDAGLANVRTRRGHERQNIIALPTHSSRIRH